MVTKTFTGDDFDGFSIEAIATGMAGNWLEFESYGRHHDTDDDAPIDASWTVVYTSNRDSCILDQANAQVIETALSEYDADVRDESSRHWAVGHVSGHAIRVYAADGSITAAFRKYVALQIQQENEIILDETLHSKLIHDAAVKLAENCGENLDELSEEDWDAYYEMVQE